jgi:APA family basic amino acid/polyamine antiporter
MIVIGLVIGMGIFRTAKDAAAAAISPSIYFAAWIAGGVIALCGALTYAEIGSRYPVIGGYYRVFSYAYHPSLAFALNCSILLSNAASIAGVALIGAGYILPVFSSHPTQIMTQGIATAAIVIFYCINVMGLRMSATAENILMSIKLLMLVALITALFFPSAYDTQNVPLFQSTNSGWNEIISSFGLCLVAVSFTYGGYQQTINFGSEVDNARRNIPRGITIGLLVIFSLYLLTNIAYYSIIGFNELKESREIASIVIGKAFGDAGAKAFSVLLFFSVLGFVNVNLLSNPRVMYAMSEDGVLPANFQKKSERKGVYTVSLAVFSLISVVVVFFAETFERVLAFSMFLDSFGMVTSAASIFKLRKETRHLDGQVYKMKLFPLFPLLFMLGYVLVCIVVIINKPFIALTGFAFLVGFGLLYFFIRRR